MQMSNLAALWFHVRIVEDIFQINFTFILAFFPTPDSFSLIRKTFSQKMSMDPPDKEWRLIENNGDVSWLRNYQVQAQKSFDVYTIEYTDLLLALAHPHADQLVLESMTKMK